MGGAGNDTLRGGRGDDTFIIRGFEGADRFDGGEGVDVIRGRSGNDIIALANDGNILWGAGPGSSAPPPQFEGNLIGIEAIDGGDGYDILRFNSGKNSYDLSAITLTSIEKIEGGFRDDWIIGSNGDDVIEGGHGADVLFGGLGNDTFLIRRLDGPDRYDGGDGFDTIRGSDFRDVLQLRNGTRDLVSIESIEMGRGNDVLTLTTGNDEIDLSGISVTGLERIEGLSGNDRIRGSSADDHLVGGAGRDVFIFAGAFGNDSIVDFERMPLPRGGDLIDLSAFRFASFSQLLSNTKQIGSDSVIFIESTASTVTIENISTSLLKADHFIL